MKKTFLFFSLFLIIFSNLSFIFSLNNNLFYFKNKDSQICGSTFVDVTDANEFIDAANANKNICVINDIDFSSIPANESIETYSGVIDGQFHTLSNHNYVLNYNENKEGIFDNYLFHYFNGTIKDITFENFPFIFEYIDGENTTSEYNLENIVFTNFDIEDLYIIIDQSIEQEFGLISKEIINTNSENLSFTNFKFDNNQIYSTLYGQPEYTNAFSNFYFSLFSSKIQNSNFSELYFMNIEFLYNTISSGSTNLGHLNQSIFRHGILRMGVLFTADGIDVNMQDSFINSLNFSNNTIISPGQLKLGFLYGNFQSVSKPATFTRIYETNCFFENNILKFSRRYLFWGTLIGYSKSSISINFDSVVINNINGNISSNKFYNFWTNRPLKTHYPGELTGKDEISKNTFYNDTYYVNKTGTGSSSKYLYTKMDKLTLDFWTNTVNFDESEHNIWNLEVLFDEDLNISTSKNSKGEIYGFPLFSSFDYLNTKIDNSQDTYIIEYNYVPSKSATYSAIESIFGDKYILEYGSHYINTEISTFVPLEDFKSYYWINLEKENLNETSIILGDIISHISKDLYEENPDIKNNIDLSLNNNNLNYDYDLSYDENKYENIIFEEFLSSEIKVIDDSGVETLFSLENNTLSVPSYVNPNNINSFYRVELNYDNYLLYITPNKKISEIEPSFIGDLNNTSKEFEDIEEPYLEYEIDYNLNLEDKTSSFIIYLNLIDPNDVVKKDNIDLETEVITIGSKFAQFDNDLDDNDFETTIKLNDFDILDPNNPKEMYYEIDLDPLIPLEDLNNYYWIEQNDNLSIEYYYDISGDTLKNDNSLNQNILNSDLTNTSPVPLYDLNQNFQLEINTFYNEKTNILFLQLITLEIYTYDIYYDLNLILKNAESSISFSLGKNNISYQIELNPNLPYSLEQDSSKDINNYYSLELDPNKNSYITFLNKYGQIETITFNEISSIDFLNSKNGVSEIIYINGDLTNTNSNNLSSFITPPIIEPPSQNNNNLSIELIFVFLSIIFLIILVIYFLFSSTSDRKYLK